MNEEIYLRQCVELVFSTGKDLTNATSVLIRFQRPDGTRSQWTATKEGNDIVYTTTPTDLIQVGTWAVQPVAIIDGKRYPGLKSSIKVHRTV
jgi:hypothetical protein